MFGLFLLHWPKSLFPYMILWKNLTIFLANPLPFDQYEYRCTCTCLSTIFKMVLYLTVELLGQMVILCLTFSETAEQLCREAWAIYMSTGSVQRVTISPHSHKSLLFCCKKYNVGNFVVNHQGFTSCFRGRMFSHQLFSELSLSPLGEKDESLHTILASFQQWWLVSDQGVWKSDFYWQPSVIIFGSRLCSSIVDKYQSPKEWNESSVLRVTV